jgi:polysaccharide pyruvyl transferase WcaK-like protein
VSFAFNPGEFSATKAYFAGMTLLLPWLILARLKGGKVIWVGAAIGSTKRGFFWPFRSLARLADLLYWRDNRSREIIGFGEELPDWGFALRSGGKLINVLDSTKEEFPGFEQRQYVGIALRGDRPYPSKEWLAAIEAFATTHNYGILAISQVEDDSIYAERIARELGGEALLWSGGDHFAQEERVRDAYRKTAAVFSDRLHGLIMAATEGAVPLGWVESATDKLNRHLQVVHADWAIPSASPISQIQSLTRKELLKYHEANIEVITRSRERLLGVMNEIQQTLSADARS